MKEGTVITLEGYGTREGQTAEVTFVGKKGDLVILQAVEANAEGKKPQGKFRLADGVSIQAKAEGGLRIPESVRKELSGAKAASNKAPRAKKAAANDTGICFCGCGNKATSRFIQGHDAKAHSQVKKFLRGQLPEAELTTASEYVRTHVKEEGGYNSQEAPKHARKSDTDKQPPVIVNGKALYGSAAKAALKKQEAEKNGQQAEESVAAAVN